jgi:dTDP-4-amino-4,6-dideoxygalactose transaminase
MVLSFNGNKNITSGGGGAILSNNDSLAKKIKHISTTARIGPNYDHDEVGYNYRMTNLQAAVGCAQLEQLAYFQERKAYISNFYKDAFQNISEITFFHRP